MEITYRMTPEDVVAFNRHQFETSPSLQRSYRLGFLWGLLAAAAVYLVLGAWTSPWNGVFPVLFLIIYFIWYPLSVRERLRPPLMKQNQVASETGLPPMRPLFVNFPADARAAKAEDQFMLGPDLLVAPVVDEGARQRAVYLPAGADWVHAWTGAGLAGGQTVAAPPLDRVPVYWRHDSAHHFLF